LSVTVRDDLAVELGRYQLEFDPAAGGPAEDHGKYVMVHRRGDDGTWRWSVDSFSSNSAH
jgi:ketosteroid isomerase-like protein